MTSHPEQRVGHAEFRQLKDSVIDSRLNSECVAMLKPYRSDKDHGSIFVIDTILTAINLAGVIDHSILTGLIYGALCQEHYSKYYPHINFFTGFVTGLVHDAGKYEQKKLFNSAVTFTSTERELAKNHVGDTVDILESYPIMQWLVEGHHLYGQPDAKPYPENLRETNIHMRSLQRALAVADKAAASIELRPELTPDELRIRQTIDGKKSRINRLFEWFKTEKSPLVNNQIKSILEMLDMKFVVVPYKPGEKIQIEDNEFKNTLIDNGYLTHEGSSIEFCIEIPPFINIDSVKMAKLLAGLTQDKTGFTCKVFFENRSDKVESYGTKR